MTDYIREELINGNDECLNKVLKCLEERSSDYYKKLCEVFGSTEYFDQFKKCYETVQSPDVDGQALSPLHEHLCAILEWRSLLATEVEALQAMKAEIEDYPKDFEIQIRLSESLHEQNRLRRELDTLKEQAERLRMENNAYSAVIDEVKKDYIEKLAEANERAKKAEKAFIDLTRHRSTHPAMESTNSSGKSPDAALQKRTSETMLNAMSPYPFKSSLEKVQSSSMRFKVYSTLTAWEGFDSLDEDSSDDDIVVGSKAASENVVEPTSPESSKLETPLMPEARPSTPEGVVTKLPDLDASPIMSSKPVGPDEVMDDAEGDARASLSSTPRKSLPSPLSKPVTPRENEVSTPEPSASVAAVTSPSSALVPSVLTNPPIQTSSSTPRMLANSSGGGEVVDKAMYLQLYNEVLELRSELAKVNSGRDFSANNALSNSVAPGNELGSTTQLDDIHDQAQETSFASPARVPDGGIFPINPIPLRENKHFTDWSISLDQTNASCAAMDASENDGFEGGAKTPRASVEALPDDSLTDCVSSPSDPLHNLQSVGQQTALSYFGSDCSSDSVNTQSGLVPLPEVSASALGVNMLSPASTLQELNVDFSESLTRQDDEGGLSWTKKLGTSSLQRVEEQVTSEKQAQQSTKARAAQVFAQMVEINNNHKETIVEGIDASSECHLLTNESVQEHDLAMSESLNDAAAVCVDLLRRLSAIQSDAPLKFNYDIKDELNSGVVNLKPILQELSTEVERISRSYVELEEKQACQPSYEAEVIKLREQLEEAKHLLEVRSPSDSRISARKMNEVLQAEREQLQRELDQRLADCDTTHATSIAELEQVQADLSARLNASEVRANNLEAERNSIAQKFNATERFLNEQLQEREQEREEFQTEVSGLREEISTLRSKVTTLERQRAQESASNSSSLVPTPQASPRKPKKSRSRRSGVQTLATSTPATTSPRSQKRARTLTPSLFSLPDSDQSDVDDSPPFELAPTPNGIEPQLTSQQHDWANVVGTPFSPGGLENPAALTPHLLRRAISASPARIRPEMLDLSWSEDSDYHSPGDCEHYYKKLLAASQLEALEVELHRIAYLRSEIVRSEMNLRGSRPLSAGDAILRQQIQPPMKLVTTSVGGSPVELVDASISAQTSLSGHSSGSSTEIDGELGDEEVDDVETTTTTAAAMGLITTVTTTKRKRRNVRHNRTPSHMITSPEVSPNNLGLDVEMRHVAEMQELREALVMAQNSLAEKDTELEGLRAQLELARKLPGESVEVQTLTNTPPDPGACWSCKAQLLPPNPTTTTAVAAVCSPQIHPPLTQTRGSRDSTLSPPPISDRNSGSSSNAEASCSAPTSGASSQDGEVEDQIVNDDDEEEEMYQQVEHVSSSESDHLAADLEEARAEIATLKAEINGLMNYQDDLHRDFELVQSMLEERQSEVERLQKELLDVPIRLQADFDASVRKLQKRMTEKCEVVEERDEDLYVLNEEKEALTLQVKELEKELAHFRENTESGISREDTASQTDPPYCTVESGIQVDLERSFSPFTKADQSRADTDCDGEEDLPFDSDFITSMPQPEIQSAVPIPTTGETLAAVDQLQQESCRLLSLSLTAASSADPNDYKSQLISKLIEANRMLKSVIENVTKEEPSAMEELTHSAPKNKSLSNPLYSSLLSALLADRRTNLALLTVNAIDQTSNAAVGRSSKGGSINDVMKALARYATAEEERWKEVSSALASDRKGLLADVDSMKRRQDSLLEEVAHLTNQLSARDATLAQKSAAAEELAGERKALEAKISDLKKLLEDAKTDKENIIEMTRSQIEEERQRVVELESTLEASQNALQQAHEQVASLENDLQRSSADVKLEQNRSRLAETRIVQLEQEVKAMKSSYVRVEPKSNVNAGIVDARKNYPSTINQISNQLASVRLQAIKAEKMSRELHACNQNLRVSIAEAELALLPLSLGKENGQYLVNGGGSGSGSTSGDDDSAPYSAVDAIPAARTIPKQLTDSGFADAPAGLRRLHVSCMRLLRLVSLATGGAPCDAGSPSSSSDSLNNPAELLRYAVLGGKKSDYTEQHPGPAEVYACLADVESHVRALVGGSCVGGTPMKFNTAASALLMQAKQLILTGVAQLDTSLAQTAASVDGPDSVNQTTHFIAPSRWDPFSTSPFPESPKPFPLDFTLLAALCIRVLTECKSTQCSLVANHQSSSDSRTVSLEKPSILPGGSSDELFRHMSARYLRMESYRRALVYQKQYLLLLLGDFQHSVQKVTASLGQGLLMGTSSRQDLDGNLLPDPPHWPLDSHPPLVRFRAAARCIMVIHRAKQLRLKWQRTGIRSHAPVHLTSEGRTPTLGQSNVTTTSMSSSPTPQIPLGSGIVGASQLLRLSSPSPASRPRFFSERNSHSLSPATGFLNSGLDAIHRRNNSASPMTQLPRPSFPRMDAQHYQMEVSSSFRHQQERQAHHQLHRVPTSSPSVVTSSSIGLGGGGNGSGSRFRWDSFRG
ncbi:hypothetical protein Aperf_G00000065641 [Anoplocephala perfoliata]